MLIEKSKSKRARCSICGEKIEDEYRLFDSGNSDVLFYHIGCLVRGIEGVKNVKDLERRLEESYYKSIPIRDL